MTGMADKLDLALTKDEQGDAIEDSAHVSQKPHGNSQLWRKHNSKSGRLCVFIWEKSSTTLN